MITGTNRQKDALNQDGLLIAHALLTSATLPEGAYRGAFFLGVGMNLKFAEIFQSIGAARKFTPFFEGVDVRLPGGAEVKFKIISSESSHRQTGYRLAEHSVLTEVRTSGGVSGYGYGESDLKLLAVQKSISEAVERSVFTTLSKDDPTLLSSSGWAAHFSADRAQKNARDELLERDAVLLHWLTETPCEKLDPSSLPVFLSNWFRDELKLAKRFNRASVLLTHLGNIPSVTVIIHDESGYGFAAHASAISLADGVWKALSEVCRVADYATQGFIVGSGGLHTADDHALYYFRERPFPAWVFSGPEVPFSAANVSWTRRARLSPSLEFQYVNYHCGPLVVSRCVSENI